MKRIKYAPVLFESDMPLKGEVKINLDRCVQEAVLKISDLRQLQQDLIEHLDDCSESGWWLDTKISEFFDDYFAGEPYEVDS